MKVLAISGSPRPQGNTQALLEHVLEPLREAGHECELIRIGGRDVRGCTACRKCFEFADNNCHGRDDYLNEIMPKVFEADVLILGSPTYFADVTTEMKAFIDRVGYVAGATNGLKRKIGAAVVVARREGGIRAFDTINHLFTIREMITVGSSYWNDGIAGPKGAIEQDEEGLRVAKTLGENIAWLAEKLEN